MNHRLHNLNQRLRDGEIDREYIAEANERMGEKGREIDMDRKADKQIMWNLNDGIEWLEIWRLRF